MSQDNLKKWQDQVWQIDDEIMSFLGRRGEKDYLEYIAIVIEKYKKRVGELINIIPELESCLREITNYEKKIDEAIRQYLQGKIVNSIHTLESLLISNGNLTATYFVKDVSLLQNDVLYRCRKNEEKCFEKNGLFHVPFDKRGLISTMRFSVPGYPCLYMGSSPYCCWKEVNEPTAFTIAKIRCIKKIKVLDMRFKVGFETNGLNNNKVLDDIRKYLIFYPFKIACCIPVGKKHQEDKFKPEYILPQLLLHISIIHNEPNARFQGVLATSTKYFKKPKIFGNIRDADNYIFPARLDESDFGLIKYSKWLEKHFKVDSLYDSHNDTRSINKSNNNRYWRNVENELKKNKLR